MPRSKANTAKDTFAFSGFRLTGKLISDAIDLLNLDVARRDGALTRISIVLGRYIAGKDALNGMPRPTDYVKAATAINRDAVRLMATLQNLGEWIQPTFEGHGADLEAAKNSLRNVLNAAATVTADMKLELVAKKAQGRPKNVALDLVAKDLNQIFQDFDSGLELTRMNRRQDFIAMWFKGPTAKTLRRMFSVPKSAEQHKRNN